MEQKNNVEVVIEIVPVLSFFSKKSLIKLTDSAYGEWLIFRNNEPLFYLNIFDPEMKELKNKIDLNEITIDRFINMINKNTHQSYSTKFKFFGILNYKQKKMKTIPLQKLPISFLEFLRK